MVFSYLSHDTILGMGRRRHVFLRFAPDRLAHHHYQKKKGDIYVTDRRQRFWPFVSAIAGYAIFLGFIAADFGWSNLLTRVITGSTLLSVFLLFVSLRWKISIHATGNSVAIAGLAVLDPTTMWFTLPLHLLVLWARHAVKAHTVVQLLVGTILGFAVPLGVIYLIP